MSKPVPLSSLARDPVVAAFLRRGEQDGGAAYAVPPPKPPVLHGGSTRQVALEEFAAV